MSMLLNHLFNRFLTTIPPFSCIFDIAVLKCLLSCSMVSSTSTLKITNHEEKNKKEQEKAKNPKSVATC